MILNLGCGYKKLGDSINIDKNPKVNPDLILDFDIEKLPFEDNSIDKIYCHHILEHMKNFIFVMKEIYRVCKNNAIIEIICPHPNHSSFLDDPTHVQFLTPDTFYLFNKEMNLFFIKNNFSNSCLALEHDVNFKVINTELQIDPKFEAMNKYFNTKNPEFYNNAVLIFTSVITVIKEDFNENT